MKLINKRASRFIILVLGSCIFSANLSGVAKAADQCTLEQQQDRIVLGNGLCQIVWNKTDKGWSGIYQAKVKDRWQTVAWDDIDTDAAYGIVFQGPCTKSHRFRVFGTVKSTLPPATSRPEVLTNSDDTIKIRWLFNLDDDQGNHWPIESTYVIGTGDYHIKEETHFHAPVYTKVRFERGWQARNIKNNFYENVVNTVTHSGWTLNNASFLAVANQGPDGWNATTGGGGFVRFVDGFKIGPGGLQIPVNKNSYYNIFHRAPHVLQKKCWIDTRYFEDYTLRHYLIFYPGKLYERQAIDYLRDLQPLEELPLRYSWKTFMDKQVESLKNAPPELFEDHGDWGHNELGWFNGFNDPLCTPKTTFLQTNRQALDWGGNWDLWQAIALREYGLRYKDKWALERARKLFNGIKREMWQIDDAGTVCDGAFWMFRPRTQAEYEERKATKPTGEQGGHIRKSADLWVCDSGKIGYWLAEMSQQLDDNEFLEKAKRAATFLLNLQQEDGNLRAGRIHISGTAAYPANLASNSCAIMLWSRLYEITKDEKYKKAAIRCADYTMKNWLNGKEWKMYGGEWDSPGNIASSSANYATWGFAILYRATQYEPALTAVRLSADWQITLQALFDTHFGFYAPKAYWRGRDARTTGGVTQCVNEGYGYLLWNRPEMPYAQYLAWKATGDDIYLNSAKAYLVWQMYMQHNCPYDYRFHGGASEGLQWTEDHMNGFGTVYIGETIGCDITLFGIMDEELKKQIN